MVLDAVRHWIASIWQVSLPQRPVVVNGLVLAEDGKKMSKSLMNYSNSVSPLE